MTVDYAVLAAQVAALLTPYLIKGGEGFASEMGKKLAEKLYGMFQPKIEAKDSAKEAEQDVIASPDDKGALASFEHQIKKILLAEDTRFAEKVSVTLGDVDLSSILAGDGSLIIKGDVSRSKIIHAQTYIEGNVYSGPAPRNPQDALKIYRAVIANMTSSLSLRGIDLRASDPNTQRAIGLANVYIDLNTTAQIEEKESKGKTKRDAKTMAKATGLPANVEFDLLQRHRGTRPLSALEAAINNQLLIMKGDPGSGKSTFVNFLTYCLSTQTTGQLKGWKKQDADLLPVIVILRDFMRAFKKLPAQALPSHIWDFIEKRLKDQKLLPASKPIQELLEDGKVILFFDGLDEVSTVPQRIFVRDAVQAFVKRYPKNRYVVTCRILSYTQPKTEDETDLRLSGFPEFELAPFDDDKINSFIDHWYGELTHLGIVTPDDADDLNKGLKTAVQREELSRLAPNPLLLTVMAVVNTHKGRLPDARALLYKETVEILLWQWEQSSKGQEAALLRQLLLQANCADADLEQVICKLAYEAHAQTDAAQDDGEILAGISELNLQKALASINKGNLNWAASVIETMKMRAGLLLERESSVFTFPHRSFQEFLAGTYIESRDDFVPCAKELAENLLLWRQVILWAVSRRVYIRGSLDGPLALIAELCPSRAIQEDDWDKVWLAGDILSEIGTNRVERSELGLELLPRVQNRLVELIEGNHLPPRERAEAGNTLARLGDPRAGVIHDFVWCEVLAGKFIMGSNKKDDKYSSDDEQPQFEYTIKHNYFISRYPVTNAQFNLFVEGDGYKMEKYWSEAKQAGYWSKGGFKGIFDNGARNAPENFGASFGLPNHPVVGVSWYEALAFTRWLTNKFRIDNTNLKIWTDNRVTDMQTDFAKYEVRLPTEAEWEKAARGMDGLLYPWGKEITPDHANYSDSNIGSTSAVGCFPKGQSPYGLLDMSGNVWEWCATKWVENYKSYGKKEDNDPSDAVPRVLRGGAFYINVRGVRCACRFRLQADFRFNVNGFRVVVASPISPRSGS